MKPSTDSPDIGAETTTGRGRRGRRRNRRDRRRGAEESRSPFGGGRLDFGPRPMVFVESRPADEPGMFHKKKRRIDFGAILAGLFGIGTLVFVGMLIYRGTRVELDHEGLDDGDALDATAAAELVLTIDVGSDDRAGSATLTFDGEPVEEPEVEGQVITWRPPGDLEEGDHSLVLDVPRPAIGDAEFRWDFTVDRTVPTLEVGTVDEAVAIDQATAVEGTAEAGSTVTADGREVDVDGDGRFRLEFGRPPAGPVAVRATDPAGNHTTVDLMVPLAYPEARAVHMTAASWDSAPLRGGVLQLLDERRIDTVVIDLKDQDGVVGFDTQVARAREIGAVTTFYDLEDLVATVESHGGRVVGRIAAFRDPVLARAAWGAGQGDQVIQTPDGQAYEDGQFTNFANAAVRQYNLDIALDAVGRGVTDILWDDARRPGSAADTMLVPGLSGAPEDAIVGFLAEAHTELRRRGAYQGVRTAGIAVTNPGLVSQDVGRLARNADYLVPTIHPSDWRGEEFGLSSGAGQPYDMVFRVLERYQQMAGDTTTLVPSLQDFSYGDGEVRAEVDGARARGVSRFLLWDPSVRYAGGALDPAS